MKHALPIRLGISDVSLVKHYGEAAAFDIMAEAAVPYVDHHLERFDPAYRLEREFPFDFYTALRNGNDARGVSVVQTHAFHPTEALRVSEAEITERLCRSVRASAILGAKYIVVHPQKELRYAYDACKDERMTRNLKFYRALIPALGETGVKCALENMFYRAPEGIVPTVLSYGDETAEMIDRLNADAPFFCACMDFGHANLLTDDGGIAMADTLGSRIAAVHLHDNDGIDDLHASPGKGSVPWRNVFGVLSDIGFDGVYNFELHDYLGADRAATVRRLSETRSALETLIKDTCRLS